MTAMASASMSVAVGDGASTRMWTDNWAPVGTLSCFAPTLFAAVSRTGRRRLLRDVLVDNRWATGLCDYLKVWDVMRSVQLQPATPDRFIWK